MKRAITLSEKAGLIDKSGGAFGAVIVHNHQIIAEGWNQVIKDCDPTCHAEMDAIRKACKVLRTPHLVDAVLYTSAYCCPMCLSAAYWAQIKTIYYASTVDDAKKYGSFKDLDFYRELGKKDQDKEIHIQEFMRQEAVAVWQKFAAMQERAYY